VDKNALSDAPEKHFIIRGHPDAIERAKQLILEKAGLPAPQAGNFPRIFVKVPCENLKNFLAFRCGICYSAFRWFSRHMGCSISNTARVPSRAR